MSTARRAIAAFGVPAAAALGGAVATLAFHPANVLPAAIAGPALGLWSFRRSGGAVRGALAGLAYGLAFTFLTYRWMAALDLVAYVVLGVLQALFWMVPGAVAGRLSALPHGWWVTATAAAWTVAELLRARFPLSGFEWGQLGVATAGTALRRGAALIGSLGLTTVLVTIAAGLVVLAVDRRLRSAVPVTVAVVALGAVTVAGSVWWTEPGETLDVALVQADPPCPGAFAEDCPGYGDMLLQAYVAGTQALPVTPELIVWGEDALPGGEDLEVAGQRFVDRFGPLEAPLLAGTGTSAGPGRFYRWAALFDRDGTPLDGYIKRVPVPFGEYVPLRGLLGGISDVGRLVPSDAVPGRDTSPVDVPTAAGRARLGTVVSWEVTFSRLVRAVARDADGLATLTTVSSYGTTEASDQLLAIAQLRAAEHQKPMAVAATTGRSALISPDGTLERRGALFRADAVIGQMALREGWTPYARTGNVPLTALAVAALALTVVQIRRGAVTPAGRDPRTPADSQPVDASSAS